MGGAAIDLKYRDASKLNKSSIHLLFHFKMATEAVTSLILSALDVDGLIASTEKLRLDGQEIEQQTMYGAISSLWSREVGPI
jgi:hypothetical protein